MDMPFYPRDMGDEASGSRGVNGNGETKMINPNELNLLTN